ncbi:MAG: DNA repair protein RecN [Tannerellaceae bacterium]|jgi:DNA repair protein RecN (Recombination protein N)|nr:DNA repair protein RecN [Tannerellaceae bacterium]
MLKSLFIQNFVLIDHLDIKFNDPFTVITGETGAGKSIILGALSLALGQRADTKSIKGGADKCTIESIFDISAYNLEPFFNKNDLEYDPTNCILRRELFSTGKSRAFVNDAPASLSVLKELGTRLIDIHSQHQNLLLSDAKFQLKVVDIMAGNDNAIQQYRKYYVAWTELKKELAVLTDKASRSKQDEEYIRYQLQQLEDAKLLPGELELLENEQEILAHAEEIKTSLYKITQGINGDETGAVHYIKEAITSAEAIRDFYPRAEEMLERLRTAYIDMNDLASETDGLKEDIDFDPERFEYVNQRLDMLYSLQQKHRQPSVEALIELRETYSARLKDIESFDESLETLKSNTEEAYAALLVQVETLRKQRNAVSEPIARQLASQLAQLGMPNTRFRIDLIPKNEPESDGCDEARFMFSANKSGELDKVAQTASGGEISRLMLCIKAMIAGYTALPAIIFDEVDTGVSGDIADKMGNIMQELGKNMQVIAITHLPQIAAKGNTHYFVFKEDTSDATRTQIRKLEGEDRLREIARMLSGASLSEAAIANAKELLQH